MSESIFSFSDVEKHLNRVLFVNQLTEKIYMVTSSTSCVRYENEGVVNLVVRNATKIVYFCEPNFFFFSKIQKLILWRKVKGRTLYYSLNRKFSNKALDNFFVNENFITCIFCLDVVCFHSHVSAAV